MTPMYDDILIPTDGSDTVPETLTHALPIANANDARIHALYVVDNRLTTAAPEDTKEPLTTTLETEGEQAVTAIEDEATAMGLETTTDVRAGTPSKAILDYATDADIDLIVIGTRGKSPREKIASLGSVSERVVDNAPIPVLVVRNAGSA